MTVGFFKKISLTPTREVKLDPLSVCEEGKHSIGFLVGEFGNSFSFMGK
jgi:hypothetical protein